jgi:excinuclease ABC subunit C
MKLQYSSPFEADRAQEFFESLPPVPAVFVLWPEPDPPPGSQPYLGRTRNLRHRLERLLAPPGANSRRLNLRDFARRVDYQLAGSSFETTWMVYQLNRAYFPKIYRQRLRLKPPALLKVNLSNRFPRCYPTRRLVRDGSLYYGPFPSRSEAERFAGEFLDLFKVRRCVEDLEPDPSHPGCIYSQMHMCLAPCFAGCTDAEYKSELDRSVQFLDTSGLSLERELEAERAAASEGQDFEKAARAHQRLEKVREVLRRRPALAGNVTDLHALIVERGAEPASVVFFRICGGELHGPAALGLNEKVASPAPLDQQIQTLLTSLTSSNSQAAAGAAATCRRLPPWEHLALISRWYYSGFRDGEFVPLKHPADFPHAKLIRICRKLTAA